jgi:hypothetical protein
MKGMRQLFTKGQWFVFFNCLLIAALYFTDNLRLQADYIIADVVALLLVNGATLISANRHKDWKK